MRRVVSLIACVALAACTTAQQTAIESAVAKNAVKVQAACAVVLPIAQSLPANILSTLNIIVSDVQKAVVSGCGTADGLAAMALSASTVPWLQTAQTVLLSKGAILPPAVAPVPLAQ